MFTVAADPKIWALHPVNNRHTEPVFRAFFDSAIASGSAFSFVDQQCGKIIGSSRYYRYNPAASEIEIGWTFLARAYWDGSYNLEIERLMLAHAFKFVDTVVFWVGETNWRSQLRSSGRSLRRFADHVGVGLLAAGLAFATRRAIMGSLRVRTR
jgi:N-acetyltransferase